MTFKRVTVWCVQVENLRLQFLTTFKIRKNSWSATFSRFLHLLSEQNNKIHVNFKFRKVHEFNKKGVHKMHILDLGGMCVCC